MNSSNWQLAYDKVSTGVRAYGEESLLTLGNGYLGWRGAPIMTSYSDDHYPGLYVAGVFNQTSTPVAGRDVINEDMVNLPNPQLFKLYVDGDLVAFDPTARQSTLHFDTGILSESYTIPTAKGNITLKTKKAVNPIKMHQIGLAIELSGDFTANITVQAIIDGCVENKNVKRYRDFESREFDVTSLTANKLIAETKQSKIKLVVGAKTMSDVTDFSVTTGDDQITATGEFTLSPDKKINIERIVGIATSYEEKNPEQIVNEQLKDATFEEIAADSFKYWQKVWDEADIVLESNDPDLQRMIRMNVFHLRQSAQHNANQYLDASVGSRGLTGEGYRGHIFWDEIFVVPYLAANDPETAKDILRYRITRLDGAKLNAQTEGESGAMYPWQSGMTGDEQAQIIHLNTVNNEWDPDNSRLQRHVSLAVVYNLWVYVQITGDESILLEGGLDVVVETSRFWLNKVILGDDGRYHLSGVMGPDEFHEAYPNANTGGITDNAYTNLMLTWALNWLQELGANKHLPAINTTLLEKAQDVSTHLSLEIDNGIIAQYAGYFDLKEVDFEAYSQKYGDIHRIDRLMKAEGLSPDDYQVAKQTDTLMTLYNLGSEHVIRLVNQLGYTLPSDWLKKNTDYYLARTVHGSTTSRPVFAGIDISLGNKTEALDFLKTAIGSDYYDIQGGTTAEGIHIGVMGETLAVIQNEFGGVSLRDGHLVVNPSLPDDWTKLSFKQIFHGILISLDIYPNEIKIKANQDISVTVYHKEINLRANEEQHITED